ncbi:MAG: guanylate kinase [Lachnospiraceae bacterium]
MGYIFYLMGKSSSGKDTIYKELTGKKDFPLKTVTGYTTRPRRSGENQGVEYYFVDRSVYENMRKKGIVIESRDYNTVYGIWTYFTADDGQIKLEKEDYIMMGTLESYEKVRNYYGREKVIPIYIEVEDGERLLRAINREKKQSEPKYAEMCRRFLADTKDFSEENIKRYGIEKRYYNENIDLCIEEIYKDIMNKTGQDGR